MDEEDFSISRRSVYMHVSLTALALTDVDVCALVKLLGLGSCRRDHVRV